MSMANAGAINYEGFGSYGNNNSSGYYDGQTRGLMFNFSFGGPKDYKQGSSIQDIYKNNLTKHQWVGIGAATLGVIVLILINEDEDECSSSGMTQIDPPSLEIESIYVVQNNRCPPPETSDRRLKEDIIKIGMTHQGLPMYSFRYIGKDKVHIGVMAQDVLQVYPEAVLVGENGYYMVDYGKLGLAHLLRL